MTNDRSVENSFWAGFDGNAVFVLVERKRGFAEKDGNAKTIGILI